MEGKDLVLAELTGLHKEWLALPSEVEVVNWCRYDTGESLIINQVWYMILEDERPLVFI